MERSSFQYSDYVNNSPSRSRAARDQARRARNKQQEAQDKEDEERAELVRKAKTMQAIAQQMSEHNETMLAGLQAQSGLAGGGDELPTGPTDFVARNIAKAGAKDGIDKQGHALLARAQVMSGAAAHLGVENKPPRRTVVLQQQQQQQQAEAHDASADLIAAALAEVRQPLATISFCLCLCLSLCLLSLACFLVEVWQA